MRTRILLLLSLGAALLLPWAGWQLVRQTEALLREGQERAQLGGAAALARALVATAGDALPVAGPALFVHPLQRLPLLDGGGDAFAGLERARSVDGRLSLVLGEQGGALYALVEVTDGSRVRADALDPLGRRGDALELEVADPRGLRRWRLANAAPGALQVTGDGDPSLAPVGEWQETADGYRVELRLPRGDGPQALSLAAIDREPAGGERSTSLAAAPGDRLPLLRRDARLDLVLGSLVPPGARLRLVSADGWVVGGAGALDATAAEATPAPAAAEAPEGAHGLLYRWLLAPPAEAGPGEFDGDGARLKAPVVWQALSGVAASNVRAGEELDAAIVSAAVPIAGEGAPRGALLLEQPSEALLVLANRAVFGVMAASLAAVLLAALVLFAYAGVLSLRIRRLRDAAGRALRPDGRLDPRLPHLNATDDLGDLSRGFARLLGEVGAYNDYLRTLASKLSHELNTPLAIVRSSLDNLEHETLPSGARIYAQRAREGAERLSGILRSMAEASRMERFVAGAEGEDFDLAELVRGCAEAYRDVVAPRRIALDVPGGRIALHGAPELIAQALDKLVDNARSFAPEDGWIRIRLRAQEDGAELAVANNGPPLPARMQERLFESLVSFREGAARGEAPHLGLGLFVVRLVAELHQGEATAVNLPEGAGVEFRLRLAGMPRGAAPAG
ncbi:MAG: ATP-binding protein [Pseudomonadota bacterium]